MREFMKFYFKQIFIGLFFFFSLLDASSGLDSNPSASPENLKKKKAPSVFLGFDLKPGFYDNEVQLEAPMLHEKYDFRCSFDGSIPTKDTPIFKKTSIKKTTVIRCGVFDGAFLKKSIYTGTYFIKETVSMPVISIAVDPYDMFDPQNGYYMKGVKECEKTSSNSPCWNANYYKKIELPVHIEFFENSQSEQAWQVDAGLTMMGQWSRENPKKSVSITMRKRYQKGRINYPLFKVRPEASIFKSFNLRNSGNRFYWDYMGDALAGALLEGSTVDYQRSRQVVVFYNGEYFGVHDLRERSNEHFVTTNYGLPAEKIESIKHIERGIKANAGKPDAYIELFDFIDSNSFENSKSKAYQSIQEEVNLVSLADYIAAQIFYRNGDWPNNNVRAWRANPEYAWKFVLYDLDQAFNFKWSVKGFTDTTNMFMWLKQGGRSLCNDKRCFATIYNKLIENPDFKRLFINRSAYLFHHFFEPERVESIIDTMVASMPIEELQRDVKRWPRDTPPLTFDGVVFKEFLKERQKSIWQDYMKEFNLLDPVEITIESVGNGRVLLEGGPLASSNDGITSHKIKFFKENPVLISAEAINKKNRFLRWKDGSKQNPRRIIPKEGATYTAIFTKN